MVHKPKHKVHSFRGLLSNGGEDEINLERQNVNLAYRVVKFQIIGYNPGVEEVEATVKIYREEQSSIVSTIDFTETDLLGAASHREFAAAEDFSSPQVIIFDNTLFSRNIYVSYKAAAGTMAMNYYIEIEEVPVSSSTLMQLKLGVARKLNLQQD
jgi:hypothetical protein